MTRLSYKVGNFETNSYNEAVTISKTYHIPIVKTYETIENEFSVDPVAREKRVAAIRAKACGN